MKQEMKTYKGEKYIYLLMAYKLVRANKDFIKIGNDNGFVGGQNYERTFDIQNYNNKILLVETKTSKGFADFSRVFEIVYNGKNPIIRDYINKDLDNCGQNWTH